MEYFHKRPSQSLTATENKQYKDSIVCLDCLIGYRRKCLWFCLDLLSLTTHAPDKKKLIELVLNFMGNDPKGCGK